MTEHVIPPDDDAAASAYVADILKKDAAEAAERASQRRQPPRRRQPRRWLVVLVPVFVALTAWNVIRLTRSPEVATPGEEAASARFSVYLVAQEVEAYRRANGALPSSLEDINADIEGITFQPADTGYTLSASVDGETITYRSGADLTPFWAAYDALSQGGGQ
jgi:hypothetical protein